MPTQKPAKATISGVPTARPRSRVAMLCPASHNVLAALAENPSAAHMAACSPARARSASKHLSALTPRGRRRSGKHPCIDRAIHTHTRRHNDAIGTKRNASIGGERRTVAASAAPEQATGRRVRRKPEPPGRFAGRWWGRVGWGGGVRAEGRSITERKINAEHFCVSGGKQVSKSRGGWVVVDGSYTKTRRMWSAVIHVGNVCMSCKHGYCDNSTK